MGRIVPLLLLAEVALVAVALISCLSAEDEEIRALPRAGWVLVILFLPLVGAVAWFSAGRPAPAAGGLRSRLLGSGLTGSRATRADWTRPQRRVAAPDDDADFLRSLDAERTRRDRELFRRWEEDLSRPDDEGRRRGPGPNPHPPPHDTPQ